MSEEGVHLPHGEHHASAEVGLGRWVAIFTAIVATFGALIGHEAEETANKAILLKNEAVLRKTDAADQWSYYQAVSTKSHLMELAMSLAAEDKQASFADKIARYEKQKEEIKAEADKLEDASAKANDLSAALSIPREKYMYGLALLQIAISVGSVTVLTGQRWLFGIALAGGAVGLLTAGLAYFAH
ncbi:MAG TPA: DUF4337 domain-containing protein [Alphaproteobacteria bacterium]|nr:DUF4337 domain-containing protein [Alphaproteobacteria bacterium]